MKIKYGSKLHAIPTASFAVHIGDHLRSNWGNRGYFMVGECGRFFFTSCERRERTSERSERVSSATPRNE